MQEHVWAVAILIAAGGGCGSNSTEPARAADDTGIGSDVQRADGADDTSGAARDTTPSDVATSDTTDGADSPAEAGGCPVAGKYSMSAKGSCGDLDVASKNERFDSTACTGSFECDGTHCLFGTATFGADGTLPATAFKLGTTPASCTGTTAGGTITLTCGGVAGDCVVTLQYLGPL
ncbi:MAG: hypothetical protein NVSMB47_08650 [Polyangiales bacterium]